MNSLNTFPSIDAYFDCDTEDRHTYVYGRVQNPTSRILEDKLAAMEHGERLMFLHPVCRVYHSGDDCLQGGSHIVCVRTAYGPLSDFIRGYCQEYFNMKVTYVSGDTVEEFEEAVTDETALVILESPSSIVFHIQDIRKVSDIAKKHHALVFIDNTYCTPVFQNPLDLGADIVMHTLSKYIGGHSDIIGGVLAVKDPQLAKKISYHRELYGGIMGSMEAWLALRGLRTLDVRMRQHESTAIQVAEFLEGHPKIRRVNYPGLKSILSVH